MNFQIEQGADFTAELDLLESDGSLMDLAGCSATMQVRPSSVSRDVVVELSSGNGRITIAPGLLTLRLTAAEAAALECGGVHDLNLTFPDGSVEKLFHGIVALAPGVSR